ncbi:MAG: hypothetical protein ACE5I3_05055 [Phycisphaerae bacterium]
MKLRWTVLLTAAWLVAPDIGPAWAQDEPRAGGRLSRRTREGRPPGGQHLRFGRIRAELDLDQDQQAEFDRLAAEFRKKRGGGANRERVRSLMDEMRRAHQEGDSERAAEIRQELREMRGGNPVLEFLDQVEGILRDDQLEKLAEIRERLSAEHSLARGGPLAQLKRLRRALRLSEEQATAYDELYAELKEQLKHSRAGEDETSDLVQKLRKAAEAGDTERIKQLRKQLPDPHARASTAIAEFLSEVESFLEPEQLRTLNRFRQRMRARGSQTDLRACFRFVSQLDLDEQQRLTLRELRRRAHRSEREARDNAEELARLTADVQNELRDMLTDEQVAEFDRWLESQKSKGPGRGRKGDRPRRERRRERSKPAGEERP